MTDVDEPPLIGYVIGPNDDAVTVCVDCADTDDENSSDWGFIRDVPSFGDRVAYPECYVCSEVMRPERLRGVSADD